MVNNYELKTISHLKIKVIRVTQNKVTKVTQAQPQSHNINIKQNHAT